ncbi:uncharacterized protein LOC124551048 isoform X5 [Schistocerca americana]|uniref:uncharacterized protein LOC124551048 isoform X5 n=1 Tax=Schistocerca americana TaxID=7009 RepID=UPI001F4F6CDF|nr:uncharacterized protein LOC124551048 isoform X5 [Schistocerca americana]
MESTGELEAVTMCGEIDIKEESVLTDPNWQLFEETEHIFIKEENVESPPQEETISPPDAVHTKKEPELQKEVEATSCGIEPRRHQQQKKSGRKLPKNLMSCGSFQTALVQWTGNT